MPSAHAAKIIIIECCPTIALFGSVRCGRTGTGSEGEHEFGTWGSKILRRHLRLSANHKHTAPIKPRLLYVCSANLQRGRRHERTRGRSLLLSPLTYRRRLHHRKLRRQLGLLQEIPGVHWAHLCQRLPSCPLRQIGRTTSACRGRKGPAWVQSGLDDIFLNQVCHIYHVFYHSCTS